MRLSNKRALDLSLKISIIEFLLFLLICFLNSIDPIFSWHQFFTSFLPTLPNLLIAIATTWYVVFTYFILQSSEILGKFSTEPFLSMSWTHSSELMENHFSDYDLPSRSFADTFGLALRDSEIEKRYINLKLLNVYQAKCGKIFIDIDVYAKTEAGSQLGEKYTLKFSSINLNLSGNDSKEITVVDLRAFPKNVRIHCKIVNLHYFPVDAHADLFGVNGYDYYECNGISMYEERMRIPQVDTNRE